MTEKIRFFDKVLKTSDHWLWVGAIQANGYGRFKFQGKIHLAHRVSWFLAYGAWPEELALHKCDVRECVNPTHLYDGSHADNRRDCVTRHRNVDVPQRGENSHLSKVSEEQVRAIRNLEGKASQEVIASQFGLTQATVSKIIRREIWSHI